MGSAARYLTDVRAEAQRAISQEEDLDRQIQELNFKIAPASSFINDMRQKAEVTLEERNRLQRAHEDLSTEVSKKTASIRKKELSV